MSSSLLRVCVLGFVLTAQPGTSQTSTQGGLTHAAQEASQGDLAQAEADIQALLAAQPENAAGWYELGAILAQGAEFAAAESAFRHALQIQPGMAKAHFSLALTLIANPEIKQDWPGVIVESRDALKYQPDYPEALNLLATALENTGDTPEAIATLRRSVELAPASAQAHFELGAALVNNGELPAAVAEYRSALAVQKDYPEAASQLGKVLFQMGEMEQSRQQLEAALCHNPDLADAHYTFARLLRAQHKNREAALEFGESQDLNDRPVRGIESARLSNEALKTAATGDLKAAIAGLQKAIALKPDYGVPHYNLGLIRADSGDYSESARELAKAISLLPMQPRAWFNLGRVLHLEKKNSSAQQALAWAARLSPSDPAVLGELASLRAAQPANEAIPAAPTTLHRPAVGAASDTAADHLAFARRLIALNDRPGAVGELLRTLTLDPQNMPARRKLAALYLQMGDKQHALYAYRDLLRCTPGDAALQRGLRESGQGQASQ